MRFATILDGSRPRVVALLNGRLRAVAADPPSIDLKSFLLLGTRDTLAASDQDFDPDAVTFLSPIPNPGKILCIGLNYRDHARENNRAIPSEPVLFVKTINTLIGHNQPIRLPKVSNKVDYEAELVVVIGKTGRDIPKDQALRHVAGYTIGHDVSARDWQFKGEEKQWVIGKSFDTFGPTGPYLVTADEIADPHDLGVRLRLNGDLLQDGNTREFIFTIPDLIAYLSQVMTLEVGDLIFTGTPAGVGVARKPPVFLRPGDVVEVEIDGLGVLRNPVVAAV